MKYALSLFALVLMIASTAAEARKYGTAGCGLGTLVFPNKDNQIFAATTNATFYSQMFGITSGTSNCLDGNSTAHNQLPAFVESNRVALENDVARGSGDTLASLSEVMGCSDTTRVGNVLKNNYNQIFSVSESDALTHAITNAVKSDSDLANTCKNVT